MTKRFTKNGAGVILFLLIASLIVSAVFFSSCDTASSSSGDDAKSFDFEAGTVTTYAIRDISGDATNVISLNEADNTGIISSYDKTEKKYVGFLGTYEAAARTAAPVEYTLTVTKKAYATTVEGLQTATYEDIAESISITVTISANNQITVKVETPAIADELKLPSSAAEANGMTLNKDSIEKIGPLAFYKSDNKTVVEGILNVKAVDDGIELSLNAEKFPYIACGSIGLWVNNNYIAWRTGYSENEDGEKILDTTTYLYPFVEPGKEYHFWLWTEPASGKSIPIKSDAVTVTATGGLGETHMLDSYTADFDMDTHTVTLSNIPRPDFPAAIEGNSRYAVTKVCQIHHTMLPGEHTPYLCGMNLSNDNSVVFNEDDLYLNFADTTNKIWEDCWAQFSYHITDTETGIEWEVNQSSSNTFTFGIGNTKTTSTGATLRYICAIIWETGGSVVSLWDDGTSLWRGIMQEESKPSLTEWSHTGEWSVRDNGDIAVDVGYQQQKNFKPTLENGNLVLTCTGASGDVGYDDKGNVWIDYLKETKTLEYIK